MVSSKRDGLERRTLILLGVFIASLILANLLGTKITTIFGISVSVGIFAIPLTFLCTDIVEEVRGKKVTKDFVVTGALALLLTAFLVWLSVSLSPAARYEHDAAYHTVFSSSLRMILASLIAFALSQYHDVWAFGFLKERTEGKYLWLRNNISTWVSQLIDTTLFMFVAFYHVTPKFTAGFIFALILPYWLFKVVFAIIDTPLVYLGVRFLRGPSR